MEKSVCALLNFAVSSANRVNACGSSSRSARVIAARRWSRASCVVRPVSSEAHGVGDALDAIRKIAPALQPQARARSTSNIMLGASRIKSNERRSCPIRRAVALRETSEPHARSSKTPRVRAMKCARSKCRRCANSLGDIKRSVARGYE